MGELCEIFFDRKNFVKNDSGAYYKRKGFVYFQANIYTYDCICVLNSCIIEKKKGEIGMAQISLRVDDDVKRKAERTFNDIGLSMSTAINIFLRTVVRENRIPFELSADPFYSMENIAELERRVSDIRSGKSTLKEHELIEVE